MNLKETLQSIGVSIVVGIICAVVLLIIRNNTNIEFSSGWVAFALGSIIGIVANIINKKFPKK
ncbi:hypothetical protein NNC19_17965 [Clostridium sp. SHJSY1]|uniref:hypothetical protein n=1 Tax=Clostridium sp. SHJSY1 TaxID=2942483 RepID=UPI0028763D15|nr:hypothetical protein [Clostridium sp. SHJSY1]MDS0527581.1 hypothetical protein [Clostridium sp. SHJSY1]